MKNIQYKTIIPTTIGTSLEWAEYTFFAFMADQLAGLFFTSDNPELARLKTYGIFATSYLIRPVGALLFGTIGDKIGRKPALVSSMLLMCFATTAIGFLPTYATLGTSAAFLLMFFRCLQGLAVSGEFNGAAVFMFEHHQQRPFFAGSLTPFAAASGMSLGALAATLVSLPNAPSFAWRIPFLCSGAIGLVALYLRSKSAETPIFAHAVTQEKSTESLLLLIKQNLKAVLLTASLAILISVYINIGSVYYKILSVQVGGLAPHLASEIVTIGQALASLSILLFGVLANKTNGRKICLMGLGLTILFAPVILSCGQSGSISVTLAGQFIYALLNGMVSAPMMTLMVPLFKPQIRFRGNALAWSIPAAIFGGTTLLVAQTLINRFGFLGPGLYISVVAAIAFFTLQWASKTSQPNEAYQISVPLKLQNQSPP